MRTALTSLLAAALLLGSALTAAPAASASTGALATGTFAGGAEAPIGLMTGLLAIGFLLAHRAMSDDD